MADYPLCRSIIGLLPNPAMLYLSISETLELHEKLIASSGGATG